MASGKRRLLRLNNKRRGAQSPVSTTGDCSGWWRRGDSELHGFRHGLDYAFIHNSRGCGASYPVVSPPDPSTHPGSGAVGEPMSLYRAGLKLAFFLPLGVAMPSSQSRTPSGFTDVSSVFTRTSRPGATLDRTPVRKP